VVTTASASTFAASTRNAAIWSSFECTASPKTEPFATVDVSSSQMNLADNSPGHAGERNGFPEHAPARSTHHQRKLPRRQTAGKAWHEASFLRFAAQLASRMIKAAIDWPTLKDIMRHKDLRRRRALVDATPEHQHRAREEIQTGTLADRKST
jgi:hypothetical protein